MDTNTNQLSRKVDLVNVNRYSILEVPGAREINLLTLQKENNIIVQFEFIRNSFSN